MTSDPMLDEIYKRRNEYAKRFGYDAHAIYEDLKKQEEQGRSEGRRYVSFPPKKEALNSSP